MFKAARWRNEKNRITAVFKLQFYVTQASEFGGNGLVLSLVPADNGKPTAKLEKSTLKDNCCYWENPVYETVKLIQDSKSGNIHERIYYFIVSTGSPKTSLVGEFSVNIADYIAATNFCSVSFPFKNNSDSHLHVSIQCIQQNPNQRDLEEDGGLKIKPEDRSLRRHFTATEAEEVSKINSIENEPLRKAVSHLSVLNGTRRGSCGSDITLSSSDSDQQRMGWELAIIPANDSSTDSLNSPRDERSQMGFDDSVDKLRADLVALSRRAEVTELELQTLRKQIVKESKRGQEMSREITGLKEERDVLKAENEKLKASQKRADDLKARSKYQFEGDPWILLEEIRDELNYEKDLNANLRLQLQKTQESNSELIFAVQDLEELLEKNNRGVSNLPNTSASGESAVEIEESILKCQSDDDEEQKALEELVRQHSNAQETYLLEQKVMDLCSEIEMYRRDKDDLEVQLEQLALDYEILKQENHEFSCKLEQSHLHEQLKMQYERSGSHAFINELEAQRQKMENELNELSKELSRYLATINELKAHNQRLEEELEKQAKYEEKLKNESNATINELETENEKLKNELKENLIELSSSLATIKELETHKKNLVEELEKQTQGFEAHMEALVHAKMEQEQRAIQAEEAMARSNATINELETHIKKLENELKKNSEVSSDTLATIKELENHIQILEEELEKQAEVFEADLEAITHAKVEQEQRAIRAEEALKLMRWKNANTAARIQDEFKRLSSQMQSSFEANEKLASKALTEASELRLQNRHLQDMFQKANEELQSAKDDYESKIRELSSQIDVKSTQIEKMVAEIEEKSKQLEYQRKHIDEVQQSDLSEKSKLRAEIERLTSENKSRTEELKTMIKERDNFTVASVKEVGWKSLEELETLRNLKNEKEQVVMNLESEVEALRSQCDNLKHSIYEDELEKEKLRKQVFQLKADLKKKDETISNIEKQFKENSGRVITQDRSRSTPKNIKSEPLQRGSKEVASKEVVTLKETIKLLEGQIKSKETALETSVNAFMAKEKDLYGKIEELEIKMGEFNQSCPAFGQDKHDEEKVSVGMQVDCSAEEVKLDGDMGGNVNDVDLINSDGQLLRSIHPKTSDNNSRDEQKFDILLKEMISLKERNNSMEIELKEMQERYSEISLKFAEVEGERQQLVMTLRNLKNAKKS